MRQTTTMRAMLLVALAAGAALPFPTRAQDASGTVTSGLSYSSQRGGLAFVTFEADNLFSSNTDVRLRYEAGEDGEGGHIGLNHRRDLGATWLGQDSYLSGGVFTAVSDWDSEGHAVRDSAVTLRFGAERAPGLDLEGRVFWMRNTLSDLADNASPLLAAEVGTSDALGLGLNAAYSTQDRAVLPTTGYRVSTDLALTTPLGDREWAAASLAGGAAWSLGTSGFVFDLSGETGRITGRNGQTVRKVDRAVIGNPRPRGFAFGGLGPRDYDPATGVDSALGGNSYALATAELRLPKIGEAVTMGAFVDAAALWDLDETAGGASGVIDDGYHLRSAAGLVVYWDTGFGLLQASYARPTRKEDTDVGESFSFGLNVSF